MLQTKRLLIRPYEEKDEEKVYSVLNSQGIYKTTLNIPFPYPREQVGIWIRFTLKNAVHKRGYEWGLFDKNENYLGNVGVVNIDWKNKNAELTYFIGEAYWKQGYATEVVEAMLKFAFCELELERVQGRCMTCNPASLRVMQKCGLIQEGIARHEVRKEGIYYDVCYSAILKNDYYKRHKGCKSEKKNTIKKQDT